MPRKAGKKFPYTPEGKAAAEDYVSLNLNTGVAPQSNAASVIGAAVGIDHTSPVAHLESVQGKDVQSRTWGLDFNSSSEFLRDHADPAPFELKKTPKESGR